MEHLTCGVISNQSTDEAVKDTGQEEEPLLDADMANEIDTADELEENYVVSEDAPIDNSI